MTDTQRRATAKHFAADWQGKGYVNDQARLFGSPYPKESTE